MSIIHDALKKVQQTNPGGAPTASLNSQEPAQAPEPTKTQDKTSIPLLVAALCAVIAMVFAALPQFTPKKNATPSAAAVITPVSITTPSQPVSEPTLSAPIATGPSANTVSQAVAHAVAAPPAPTPTQRVIDPNDPLSNIQIEGIMDMGGKKVVLINGNVYEEGQTIHGKIISEISFDSLSVIDEGRKRTFKIKP
jgi:hypothetical protein